MRFCSLLTWVFYPLFLGTATAHKHNAKILLNGHDLNANVFKLTERVLAEIFVGDDQIDILKSAYVNKRHFVEF